MIRDTVTMDQIIGIYGYRPKNGFMCCPFHGEKAPSLKVYKGTKGWHCFGCGKGGSVIDFVMEHENCNFRTAVIAIDNCLHLNLRDPKEYPMIASRQKDIQAMYDRFADAAYGVCDAMIRKIEHRQMMNYRKVKRIEETQYSHAEDLTADDYMFLLTWEDDDLYDDYKIEKINELKEEVATWRRKARRSG